MIKSAQFRARWDRELDSIFRVVTKVRWYNETLLVRTLEEDGTYDGFEYPARVRVTTIRHVSEQYFAAASRTHTLTDEDRKEMPETERKLRLLREEVQGVLERVTADVPTWEGLGKATTRISDPVPVGRADGCEYCGLGYRNGDCQLPEQGETGSE